MSGTNPTTRHGSNPARSSVIWVAHQQRAETRRRFALARPGLHLVTPRAWRDVGLAESGFRPTGASRLNTPLMPVRRFNTNAEPFVICDLLFVIREAPNY
jgi:hypothetical protein